MASQELHAKALDALVALNAAIKNIRLYPPASAMVQKSIERVHSFLEVIFQSEAELTVSESEKNLLILGTPLTEKEQLKPQVTAFIATLLDFGVKNLTFKQGVTLPELETLMQNLSRKAEEIKAEGGLQAVLAGSDLAHIVLGEKVYMAVDQDQQVVPKTQKPQPQEPVSKKERINQFKTGLNNLLQGKLEPLDDPDFLNSFPKAINQLIDKGKLKTVDTLVEHAAAGFKSASPESRPAIRTTLQQISQKLPAEKRAALKNVLQAGAPPAAVAPETDKTPAPEPPVQDQADTRETQIDDLVAAGDTDAAVKLVFELLVAYAKKKNFKKAEELRDRLYDVDAMALTEIVKAGEIIEQEKSESIDQDHLEVWPELYDKLNSEESSALFYAQEEVSYEADETIFAQGQENTNLYFITQGSLKLVYRDGERETLIKTLKKGDLAGHTTFFTISICTTSLITLSNVKMSVLPQAALEPWRNDFPALKSKLEDYCLKLEKSRDIIKAKGIERRKHPRFDVNGKILIQLLNRKQQPMGKPFKGVFADISEGGLCFYIITSKQETARMLLGRRLGLTFLIPTRAAPLKTLQHGTVLCVNYQLKNEYSIHVSFDDELPSGIAGAIKRLKDVKTE